jgi:hypothetical protein
VIQSGEKVVTKGKIFCNSKVLQKYCKSGAESAEKQPAFCRFIEYAGRNTSISLRGFAGIVGL